MTVREDLRNILSLHSIECSLSEEEFQSIVTRTLSGHPELRTALSEYLDRTDIDWVSLLTFDDIEIFETSNQDDARIFIRGLLIPLLQEDSR